MATAMPPRAWIESERYAQITEAGEARLLTERGVRRRVLEALSGAKPVRMDALIGSAPVHAGKIARSASRGGTAANVAPAPAGTHPRGSHAGLIGLERDGLVRVTQPLKGSADAHRTARVVTLTALGHGAIDNVAASALDGSRAADSEAGHRTRLGGRQREALDLLKAASEGMDASALDDRGIGASTIKRLAELGLVAMSRRRVERD